MTASPTTARRGPIAFLSFGHACVDVYQGAVAALVPYFLAERDYTYAAAAAIVLAASLLSSVVQPLFGLLVDRWPMRWLLPVATLAGGAGVALVGVSESYVFALLMVAISGIGVAAYHPAAAGAARAASAGSHTGMSWFSLGGNIGFSAAPLLVVAVVGVGGLDASPVLMLPALAGAVLCVLALRTTGDRHAPTTTAPRAAPPRHNDWNSFVKMSAAIVCRSIVFIGLSSFIAVYIAQRLQASASIGMLALFVLYLGGAFGTILGGRLANRWPRVSILRWSYALTILAVAGIVFVPGPAVFVFIAAASMGLYVPHSLHITLGQDYLPSRMGTASGVTLGLAVSAGGLAAPLIGLVADVGTLQLALIPLILLPGLSWLFMRGLPEPAAARPAG